MFDLREDPPEARNVAEDPAYAEERRELEQRLAAHLREVDEPLLKGAVAMPFYVKAMEDFRRVLQEDAG